MPQTSYSDAPAEAIVGQLADQGARRVGSHTAEEDLPIGLAVVRGSADKTIVLPTADTDIFVGVTMFTQNLAYASDDATAKYADGKTVNVVEGGRVRVLVEEAVSYDDDVYVRFDDGVADPTQTQKGGFRKSADTSTAVKVTGWKFKSTTAAGGIAILQLPL